MKEGQEYVGDVPTEEVEFDTQEIEELVGTKQSRKRKSMHHLDTPVSAKKDQSHITCFKCKTLGHYANMCSKKKPEPKEQTPSKRSPKTCRKLFVFVARKQDIMLLNVPTR